MFFDNHISTLILNIFVLLIKCNKGGKYVKRCRRIELARDIQVQKDVNHFYGNRDAWLAYANVVSENQNKEPPTPQPEDSTSSILENDEYIVQIKKK